MIFWPIRAENSELCLFNPVRSVTIETLRGLITDPYFIYNNTPSCK